MVAHIKSLYTQAHLHKMADALDTAAIQSPVRQIIIANYISYYTLALLIYDLCKNSSSQIITFLILYSNIIRQRGIHDMSNWMVCLHSMHSR